MHYVARVALDLCTTPRDFADLHQEAHRQWNVHRYPLSWATFMGWLHFGDLYRDPDEISADEAQVIAMPSPSDDALALVGDRQAGMDLFRAAGQAMLNISSALVLEQQYDGERELKALDRRYKGDFVYVCALNVATGLMSTAVEGFDHSQLMADYRERFEWMGKRTP